MNRRRKGTAAGSRERDRGFVLIGVIMFVLALTILGLSLYGLSGFEVGFLQDSIDRRQAFYDASGGLDRARWIMSQRNTLQSVKTGIPDGNGIVYVKAWYTDNGDSVGTIDWSGNRNISIRVLAVRGMVQGPNPRPLRCMVQCTYLPSQIRNLYQNLVTSSAQVVMKADQVQPTLLGDVWQNDHDTNWTSQVNWIGNLTLDGVPDPDVTGFLSRFPLATTPPATYQLLSGGPGGLGRTYYHMETGGLPQPNGAVVFRGLVGQLSGQRLDPKYEVSSTGLNTHILINTGVLPRTVIWLIERGARLSGNVTVDGLPGDRLIIIAGTSSDTPPPGTPITKNVGMWFDGGFAADCPTILVSDGTISLSHTTTNSIVTTWLSIFAGAVHVHVPINVPITKFLHPPLLDSVLLDDLIQANLLPNADPSQNHLLTPIADAWALVVDSNP